jgi:hypothetical protein
MGEIVQDVIVDGWASRVIHLYQTLSPEAVDSLHDLAYAEAFSLRCAVAVLLRA